MKLNIFVKQISAITRGLSFGLLSMLAAVFFWQGAFFMNAATAAPISSLILAADVGDQVQDKVDDGAGKAKGFIRDTADKVERTAKKNAERVDKNTDNDSAIADRAKVDAGRIKKNAERDAARTQKAVDKTQNVIEKAVDNVKDAFGK